MGHNGMSGLIRVIVLCAVFGSSLRELHVQRTHASEDGISPAAYVSPGSVCGTLGSYYLLDVDTAPAVSCNTTGDSTNITLRGPVLSPSAGFATQKVSVSWMV